MLLEIHEKNPEIRKIHQVVDVLRAGGIIVYPTDTVYAFGCDINNAKAIERICQIKGINPQKANLSFICKSLSQVTEYVLPIDNAVFREMRANMPGAYTYILKGSNAVPKLFKNNKRTVGVRIPDNRIALDLVEALGNPILSTSIKGNDDESPEYYTNPIEIYEKYGKIVDLVIDGGISSGNVSTIIDCSGDEPIILRD
jgi:tRNA threonylcarbamoyl adenosine modification protein (Sua5/YciO/YrdC/YwlC family)